MAKIQDYFKIVTPKPGITTMSDSQNLGDQGVYANYTWYQRLVQGSASRLTRYREYDLMDNDVEIARSLDTIAEEMIGSDPNSDLPLELVIQSEKNQDIPTSVVMTLRAALRYWSDLHDWNIRLFKVARTTIKYGDCFFIRKKETAKWEYIHPKNVVAAIVDDRDLTRVMGWQIKRDTKVPNSPYNQPVGHFGNYSNELVDTFPADDVVWFTLNDDISETAPFGESVLRAVYRAQKQKELLEDAIIIYRIQRAPERRVFKIDVGNMSPQRVKSYLESIKNEIRQRKVPTTGGGVDQVDSVYNPQSMNEDFFFACLSMKSRVYLLDGRTLTIDELRQEYEDGKENWTYSIDQQTGKLIPGKIDWAGYTRKNAEMVRVHLDNEETIDCTPDHKFVLRDGSEVEAQYLTPEMSLMPIYKKRCKTNKNQKEELYERIIDNSTGKWNFTHLEINPKKQISETVIHHIDYNPSNNSPTNLVELTHEDHWKKHHSTGGHTLGKLWKDDREKMINSINEYHSNRTEKQTQTLIDRNRKNGANTWINNEQQVKENLEKGRRSTRNKFETQEEYCRYMSNMGKQQWTDNKKQIRSTQTKQFNIETKSYNIDDELFTLFTTEFNKGNNSMPKIKQALRTSSSFLGYFEQINTNNQNIKNSKKLKFSDKFIYKLVQHGGFATFQEFKENYAFNHKIVKIEWLSEREDTGCLHVVDENNNHNFALAAGVYVKNSRPDGRGSSVDTLPGGQGLGELADLEYFQWKVFRGLRIPLSYMREGQDGAAFSDGKTGIAYIQELRFAMYIKRLQNYISRVVDAEFKRYIRMAGISADPTSFYIKLTDPENFGIYRQQQLDNDLLSTYGQANGVEHLSKRFTMKKYLQATDEEILLNQRLRAEELGMDPDNITKEDFLRLYGPPPAEGGMDLGGGLGGMTAGSLGGLGGMDMGIEPPVGGDMGAVPPETGNAPPTGTPAVPPAPAPTA